MSDVPEPRFTCPRCQGNPASRPLETVLGLPVMNTDTGKLVHCVTCMDAGTVDEETTVSEMRWERGEHDGDTIYLG